MATHESTAAGPPPITYNFAIPTSNRYDVFSKSSSWDQDLFPIEANQHNQMESSSGGGIIIKDRDVRPRKPFLNNTHTSDNNVSDRNNNNTQYNRHHSQCEEWNLPVNRRNSKQSRAMFGNKQTPERRLAGQRIVRNTDLFIGGISNGVDEAMLNNYLITELEVQPIDISINKINNYNRSYKVTIQSSDKNKVCCPEAWESNIIIKPFRHRQARNNQDNRNDGNSIPSYHKHQYDQDDLQNHQWV